MQRITSTATVVKITYVIVSKIALKTVFEELNFVASWFQYALNS